MTAAILSAQDVVRSVGGDITAFEILKRNPRRLTQLFGSSVPNLVVTSDAVGDVLRALRDRRVSPQQAQQWASFIRRGYLTGANDGPLRPLSIEYDPEHEDVIVEILSRLDELGDVVDGHVSDDELSTMLGELSR